LKENDINVEKLFQQIYDVIIKTIISVEPHIFNSLNRSTKYKNLCFELYGFDILIDSHLKPWLMEVNASPSLSSSSIIDKQIKTMLLCDVFNLIGIIPYDKKKYLKQQEFKKNQIKLGIKSNIIRTRQTKKQKHKWIKEFTKFWIFTKRWLRIIIGYWGRAS